MNIRVLILSMFMFFACKAQNIDENGKHQVTIYAIGDSTMADKSVENENPERGWGQLLPMFVNPESAVVENHAKDGRSSKSFFDEKRWEVVTALLQKGDYVFIQFGHNDEKSQDATRYTDPYGLYQEYLSRYVQDTRAKGAIPVLMTPIVRRVFNSDGTLRNTHGDYPNAVRELAQKLGVAMIDMEVKTRQLVQKLGDEDSKKLYVWVAPGETKKYPNGKSDNTHLSKYGAYTVAALAVEGIKELNLGLNNLLKTELKDN